MNELKKFVKQNKCELSKSLSKEFNMIEFNTNTDVVKINTGLIATDGYTIDLYLKEQENKYIVTSDDDIAHWLFTTTNIDYGNLYDELITCANNYIYFDKVKNNNFVLSIELDKNEIKHGGIDLLSRNIFILAQTVQCVIWALYGTIECLKVISKND